MELFKFIMTITCSGAVFGFIQFLINRHDSKNDKIKDLGDKMEKELKALGTRVESGLAERSEEGRSRYESNYNLIREQRELSDERYNELKEALLIITKNEEEKDKYSQAIGSGLMALRHDRGISLARKYQNRGGITFEERANLTILYKAYHDNLGGNGDGQEAYNFCMNTSNIPVITEEEALRLDSLNGR